MSDYDAWAPVYDSWAADMTEDVPFYVSLAREATVEPVVELAVGTGRVAIPIARETGKRVVGIDASPAMLEVARGRAEGLAVELRLGDMRDPIALEAPVDLVICPFRALLHMPTWRDKRLVFERAAAALRPGGRFAFNSFAFHHAIAAKLDGTTQNQHGTVHSFRYVPSDNRVDITRDDGATIRLWWATRSEWDGLVEAAGLETEAVYGWFDRRPLDDESTEFVWIARKPA
ncbi:MAG TPA: class I SAM-dependent methyltransferase [Gaiellaceae bacterium]|nr:class I SAM-dependent methyltransferase [Gaiellaceae bacterium]